MRMFLKSSRDPQLRVLEDLLNYFIKLCPQNSDRVQIQLEHFEIHMSESRNANLIHWEVSLT